MNRCPHCDHEIRFYTAHLVTRDGEWWHYACANEQHAEQNRLIDAARQEDWELESRRHEERLARIRTWNQTRDYYAAKSAAEKRAR